LRKWENAHIVLEAGMRRRVVITGMGCVTPLGAHLDTLWGQLTAGRSGVGRLTLFDPHGFPVRIAAEVRDWNLSDVGEDPRRWAHCHRHTQFAIGAAFKAVRQSAILESGLHPTRLGVTLGCGEPFEDFTRFTEAIGRSCTDGEFQGERFTETALHLFNPDDERENELDMAACHLARLFNAQGPNSNCIAACVSSAQAIGQAASTIRRGEADAMLCGGTHSTIHPFGVTGFQRLEALSTRDTAPEQAACPFDRERDGFVIGEGGAVFVLEELEHARRRGVFIWGELTGYGSSQDAYRITDTRPDGSGVANAILRALKDARLNPDDIDYVNAHGTSTVLNDKVETLALKRALNAHAYRLPISSTKSMLGHATTGCAAIELLICLLALNHQVIPPTINYHTPDPECDLDYVPNSARDHRCRHVLSNSIGFGGQNAALVVSRYDESSAVVVPRAA
jgi:3-oxoacyl-[acyl-carrier-protein] synthase II